MPDWSWFDRYYREREPASEWLRAGEHPAPDPTPEPGPCPDPDETPTTPAVALRTCAYAGCRAMIWRDSDHVCCHLHRGKLDALRLRVASGALSDFPLGCTQRAGLTLWPPLVGWRRSLQTVVVNACYTLRWWPWREPYFRGYPGGDAA